MLASRKCSARSNNALVGSLFGGIPKWEIVLLTTLTDDLEVTVLQLPAAPRKELSKTRSYALSA
jgi:hypothetical protein